MIETDQPKIAETTDGARWCVHCRTPHGDDVGEFRTSVAAQLFASAPRVLAERNRLREALRNVISATRATNERGRQARAKAHAVLKETEAPHAAP
jgi:uncharacterized membrane protein